MFGKNWFKGIGVGVWGGKDSVEPDRGDVGRNEVVSVGVFDVVMGLREKAFEGGELGERIGRFATRGPEHVEVGHKGGVVEGSEREFEKVAGGEDGEKFQADGHVRVELLLAQKGVAGDEGNGGENSAVSFREVGVDAVKPGGARKDFGVVGVEEVGVGVLLNVREVECRKERIPGGAAGERFGAGGVRGISDEIEVAREENDWAESRVSAKEEGERARDEAAEVFLGAESGAVVRQGEEAKVDDDEAGLGVGSAREEEEGDMSVQVVMGGDTVDGVVVEEGGVEGGEDTGFEFGERSFRGVERVVVVKNCVVGEERAEGGSLAGAEFGFLKTNDFEGADVRNGAMERVIEVVGVVREGGDVVGDQGEVRDRVGVGRAGGRDRVGEVRGIEERSDGGLN